MKGMRRLVWIPILLVLSGCALNDIEYDPPITPEQWCEQRPCVDVGGRGRVDAVAICGNGFTVKPWQQHRPLPAMPR